MIFKARAYAKANLSLNIVGKKDDLHTLDMLNTSIDLYDELTLKFRDDNKVNLDITAPNNISDFSPKIFAKNIQILLPKINEVYPFSGIDVHLEKNIPAGAGLGGSSAVGVAVAKFFEQQKNIKSTPEMLINLGSDIPFMFEGGCQRVQGIGEILTPVQMPEYYLLIVKPKHGISTKECYNLYDKVGCPKNADIERLLEALQNKDLEFAAKLKANQLTRSAQKLLPEVGAIKKHLLAKGGKFVVMTGSGSGIVALCRNMEEAQKLQNTLSKKWWSTITKTCQKGVEIL